MLMTFVISNVEMNIILFPMSLPLQLGHYAASTDALVHQLLRLVVVATTFRLLIQGLDQVRSSPRTNAPRNVTRPSMSIIW
jgi:hypothetical protein